MNRGRLRTTFCGLLGLSYGLLSTEASVAAGNGVGRSSRLTWYRSTLQADGVLRDIEVDGYRYCVADAGAREKRSAIVLLHGLSGSIYDWRHIQRPLAEEHRVIAVDLLGAGESDKPLKADYSLRAQARRLRGLFDALGVEKAVVVGNSYGGGVALVFAEDWPDRVERLILINSICYADHVPAYLPLSRLPGAEQAAQVLPVEKMAEWMLRTFSRTVKCLSPLELETYVTELAPGDRRRAMVQTLRAVLPEDTREFESRIRSITAPALVLWGRLDRTVPIDLGRRLAKELPRAKFAELDAGHVPNQEKPEEVLRSIVEFLRS